MRSLANGWLALLLGIAATFSLAAQTATNTRSFDWESYNVSFDIPEYMEVKTNTADLFYATSGDMFINVYPEKTSISGTTLCDEHYAELRLSDKSLVSEAKSYSNEGITGSYMIGSGFNGSSKYAFIVAGFNDDARENALKVDIQILTTAGDYNTLIEDAVDMLNSFKSLGSGSSSGSYTGNTYTSNNSGFVQWRDYDFKFDYPTDFTVNYESSSTFSADDGTLYLTVNRQSGSKSPRRVARQLFSKMDASGTKDTANDEISQGGLDGWKIIGSGTKNSSSIVYCIMAFDDPRGNNHFEVEILYYMSTTTDSDAYVTKMKDIINSFGKMSY